MAVLLLVEDKELYIIIARHLNKSASKIEEKILYDWIEENDQNRSFYEKFKTYWSSDPIRKISVINSKEVKDAVWEKLHQQNSTFSRINEVKVIGLFFKYAATILVLVCIGFFSYKFITTQEHKSEIRKITKENSVGRKSVLHLFDGSVVNLNSESKIVFNEIFSDTARVVELHGEAYFNIVHNPNKPFYVISDKIEVKVLGTSFNISCYKESNEIKVSLTEGSVLLTSKANYPLNKMETTINPGYEVSYLKEFSTFSEPVKFNRLSVEGWKDGIIFFEKAELKEIIKKLERWYGIKVLVKGSPKNELRYTGVFENQNLDNVLTSIGFVNNFEHQFDGKTVMLNFKN